MTKVGIRVGALESIDKDNKQVRLFGYGVYLGDEPPKMFARFGGGLKSPKIRLDNGKIVWGYMCWWSEEEAIQRNLAIYVANGYEIVNVDPPEDAPPTDDDSFAQA